MFAPALPGFPTRGANQNSVCGFLSKKAARNCSTPPTSTGNPGYVGRKRWAKPSTAFKSALHFAPLAFFPLHRNSRPPMRVCLQQRNIMKKRLSVAIFLLPIALAACSHPQPAPYYPPPPPAYSQGAEQGHHDGIEAARRDIANGAPPDPNRHPRFRNPPVPPPLMEDYRHAFGNGYEEVYRHGPPPRGY
jgi:hypothetical protein